MGAMAPSIIKALEDSFYLWSADRGRSGHISNSRFNLVYTFGDRRLGNAAAVPQVLTITKFWIHPDFSRQGNATEMIRIILEGDPAPRIPIKFLHFCGCNDDMARICSRLHFHRYQIGDRLDYWHAVTGQKELI
ncbi:hypothetical protein IB265_33075 [Ensifer sp. ENS10]|uniref:hypothetical protein n=1 Tax=Ensifer sp. ENS10 TaxID=2769286 RepID=UPI0017849305|nr:hypothetical protein [Ensifer sp. ENS10]MBD9511591.1 hypothetical protein [Ensifer sp. ENS10]